MAIIVSDNISLNSRQFLDARVGRASTLQDLRDWDESQCNLPNGFEVWVDSARKWYIYDSRNASGSTTGYFRERVGNSKENFSTSRDAIATREFWGLTSASTEEEIAEVLYEGKNVSVIDDLYGTSIYILRNADDPFDLGSWNQVGWAGAEFGGIMVLTDSKYNALETKPDEWVSIPEDEEGMEVHSTTTVVTEPGTNIDIIFKALRALQAEVTRLRNSFKYGIYSYTEADTAMSTEMFELGRVTDEPLWAVDESGLESIPDCCVTIAETTELYPLSSVTFDYSSKSLVIAGDEENTVKWSYNDGIRTPAKDLLLENEDSKIFAYFTSSNENIKISLCDCSGTPETSFEILFSDYTDNSALLDQYSSMICISRKRNGYGFNFIWISITNSMNNKTIQEGYYNPEYPNVLYDSLVELDKEYSIEQIEFWQTGVKKINLYSKYQDFSKNIMPSQASDTTYKYEVAHLTIRSVSTLSVLESIKDQLPENELIFVKDLRQLWIKSGNSLISLSSDNKDSGMTQEEVIKLLKEYGIVKDTVDGLVLTDVGSITFINQDNNKKYMYKPNSDGELVGLELPEVKLDDQISTINSADTQTTGGIKFNRSDIVYQRGFCSLLHLAQKNMLPGESKTDPNTTKDVGLNSDRVKIGAFYAPLSTDKVFGCSHAFVELENTSDKDFQLDGCYLHYFYQTSKDDTTIKTAHLALSGKIPAGSTYLVRGKQYADPKTSKNTFINVATYDKEWWIKTQVENKTVYELLDFTINDEIQTPLYGFMLTHGQSGITIINQSGEQVITPQFLGASTYADFFIDSVGVGKTNGIKLSGSDSAANDGVFKKDSNCIYRNTFELDPAKQAYQALNKNDSSRKRWSKGQDIQYLYLDDEYITFPHTPDIKCNVAMFTPKASFEGKNVCTDKTQMDFNRPNAVTCAFGSTSNTVRCFNWVSAGKFNEYIWLREEGTDSWSKPIESYREYSSKEKDHYSGDTVYSRIEVDNDEFEVIYNRITNMFPGNNVLYTSHKVMVSIDTTVDKVKAYEYIVGQKLEDDTPDPNHISDVQYFHLYPSSWQPVVYQTTDQQGFNWIEYQVWSAAAIKINDEINDRIYTSVASAVTSGLADYFEVDDNGHYHYTKDTEVVSGKNYYTHNEIVPVLVNTGDMTQNGTRVNEWLDHFIAAKPLVNHLEYMCIVGNNDLCNTDVRALGTGDDPGKSNGYFFHVFYCYQTFNLELSGVTEGECAEYEPNYDSETHKITNIKPIVNSTYVPSLYYFTIGDYGFAMINSELTYTNCRDWFKTVREDKTFNIYNGWEVSEDTEITENQVFVNNISGSNFTTVYTMVRAILKHIENKHIICMCHEMPFTVMTKACMAAGTTTQYQRYRSESDAGTSALIGCHMNQITVKDKGRGTYWFSRLLEELGITLVLGGHKHTFCCTWPLAENYNPIGSVNGVSAATLVNDNINWFMDGYNINKFMSKDGANLTKFPKALCPSGYTNNSTDFIDPVMPESGSTGKVTYFMCQATGYKLTSNKELPGQQQLFSRLLPKTGDDGSTPANGQKYPMFSRVELSANTTDATAEIYLARIDNIMDGGAFKQRKYLTGEMELYYAHSNYAYSSDTQIYYAVTTSSDDKRYPEQVSQSDESWPTGEVYIVKVNLNKINNT